MDERAARPAALALVAEVARVDLAGDGAISALSVYCTGDWDRSLAERHRREVTLLRP